MLAEQIEYQTTRVTRHTALRSSIRVKIDCTDITHKKGVSMFLDTPFD